MKTTVLWFRHGLRLHDNPALLEAIRDADYFLPIFIFDGESAGTKVIGYNRMRFLLEALKDLDNQLKAVGGRLFIFKGQPVTIFRRIWEELGLRKICFEQDCEPIWKLRDDAVRALGRELGIECIERVSHTLWDPKEVIETNGGSPPLTYQVFMYTTTVMGPPPRPVSDPDWSKVKFGVVSDSLASELNLLSGSLTPEMFGLQPELPGSVRLVAWKGGETRALQHLQERLYVEEQAFKQGFYLPNQSRPDLLTAPTSLSPALRFGCLSVRRFYWSVHDLFNRTYNGEPPCHLNITGQLIWREYFYTMSVNNIHYGEMEGNEICLDIPWYKNDEHFSAWKNGQTGYPFIDACMRQLKLEGWVHHAGRNAVSAFLTRGDLWISWEEGLKHFLRLLLDADWSVCAGNWMWVSSSAFEQLLDCSNCVCPVNYGRRLDPYGEYIKRYVPELRNFPQEYLYEPWRASIDLQKKANCILGKDYPERIVNHDVASQNNKNKMKKIRDILMAGEIPDHCCPSNQEETRQFMWLPDHCNEHLYVTSNVM